MQRSYFSFGYANIQFFALAAALAGCAASMDESDEPIFASTAEELSCGKDVPPEIVVEEGNKLAFSLYAEGTQIYDCKVGADGVTPAWTFRAPDADLFGKRGRIAGSHYAGPTWEALDGSTVVASRVNGVTVDPTAIPWLLLKAASNTGDGLMSEVTFIQRLDTVGGVAPPAATCDAAHIGDVADVPYTATYAFYEARGGRGH